MSFIYSFLAARCEIAQLQAAMLGAWPNLELAEPAQRPNRVDLDRVWRERRARLLASSEQVTALVRVGVADRDELLSTVLAVHAEEPDPDGWLRLEVTFGDAKHAEGVLWRLAMSTEALAPQWLRNALGHRAAAIAARYGCTRDSQITPR